MLNSLIFFWTWMLDHPLATVVLVGVFVAGLAVFVKASTARSRVAKHEEPR